MVTAGGSQAASELTGAEAVTNQDEPLFDARQTDSADGRQSAPDKGTDTPDYPTQVPTAGGGRADQNTKMQPNNNEAFAEVVQAAENNVESNCDALMYKEMSQDGGENDQIISIYAPNTMMHAKGSKSALIKKQARNQAVKALKSVGSSQSHSVKEGEKKQVSSPISRKRTSIHTDDHHHKQHSSLTNNSASQNQQHQKQRNDEVTNNKAATKEQQKSTFSTRKRSPIFKSFSSEANRASAAMTTDLRPANISPKNETTYSSSSKASNKNRHTLPQNSNLPKTIPTAGQQQVANSYLLTQKAQIGIPPVIEEEHSLNGDPSIQHPINSSMEKKQSEAPSRGEIALNQIFGADQSMIGQTPPVIVKAPSRPDMGDEQQMIEFEQALLAQAVITNIANPCMKRTMNVGPKKFVGKNPNSQVHQHTNKKMNFTDFDTMSLVQSVKTAGATTNANSKLRSRFSATSAARRQRGDDNGNVFSEHMDTNSFNSAGFVSQGLLNSNQNQIVDSRVSNVESQHLISVVSEATGNRFKQRNNVEKKSASGARDHHPAPPTNVYASTHQSTFQQSRSQSDQLQNTTVVNSVGEDKMMFSENLAMMQLPPMARNNQFATTAPGLDESPSRKQSHPNPSQANSIKMQLGLRKILHQKRKRLSSVSKAVGMYEIMKDHIVNPASLQYRQSHAGVRDRRQIRSLVQSTQSYAANQSAERNSSKNDKQLGHQSIGHQTQKHIPISKEAKRNLAIKLIQTLQDNKEGGSGQQRRRAQSSTGLGRKHRRTSKPAAPLPPQWNSNVVLTAGSASNNNNNNNNKRTK